MINNNVVAKTIQTYEELADDYKKQHFDINEIKGLADFFIKNLKGKKILDVGCGPGRDAKYFAKHGLEVIGIDLTANFVRMALKNVPNAQFIQMDMRKLRFPENPFNSILNNHSLKGKYTDCRRINIAGDLRAIYKRISNTECIFVTIGTHSKLYK